MLFKSAVLAGLSAVVYGQGQDLTAALSGNPNLSQLATLLNSQPDLLNSLKSASNITVLAPSNAALGTLLNSSAGTALASNPGAVAALLSYHVLNGTYSSAQISSTPKFLPTLLTNATYANVTGGQRVEGVLSSGNVTFFSGLLQNSTVSQANQNFTGGTLHVINRVLALPASVNNTLIATRLTSLWGALNATNLLSTVDGLRDVTIFAPNNSAFQAISSGLGNLSTSDLTKIATYHVVNGTAPLYSTDLRNGSSLNALSGGQLHVTIRGNSTFINNARVIAPNVLVAGGVVHVIDQVLNPNNATATVGQNATTGAPAFSGASSGSSAPFTSGAPAGTTTIAVGAGPGATASSSSKSGAAVPMQTGAMGAAALFGAGAMLYNF